MQLSQLTLSSFSGLLSELMATLHLAKFKGISHVDLVAS
jgi:hypothetical protein